MFSHIHLLLLVVAVGIAPSILGQEVDFDVNRFVGNWYEVLRSPTGELVHADAMEVYTIINSTSVNMARRQWLTNENEWNVGKGTASILDKTMPAKISIAQNGGDTFPVRIAYTDYDQIAVITTEDNGSGMPLVAVIYSRTPQPDSSAMKKALEALSVAVNYPDLTEDCLVKVRHGVASTPFNDALLSSTLLTTDNCTESNDPNSNNAPPTAQVSTLQTTQRPPARSTLSPSSSNNGAVGGDKDKEWLKVLMAMLQGMPMQGNMGSNMDPDCGDDQRTNMGPSGGSGEAMSSQDLVHAILMMGKLIEAGHNHENSNEQFDYNEPTIPPNRPTIPPNRPTIPPNRPAIPPNRPTANEPDCDDESTGQASWGNAGQGGMTGHGSWGNTGQGGMTGQGSWGNTGQGGMTGQGSWGNTGQGGMTGQEDCDDDRNMNSDPSNRNSYGSSSNNGYGTSSNTDPGNNYGSNVGYDNGYNSGSNSNYGTGQQDDCDDNTMSMRAGNDMLDLYYHHDPYYDDHYYLDYHHHDYHDYHDYYDYHHHHDYFWDSHWW